MSAPYSPHQNGTAERCWRTLFEMARCLIIESKLPKYLWTYAVKISAYIRNRCYNTRLNKTPFETFTKIKPNFSNMHIFGTKVFAYVQNKSKLDARCKEGKFLGYDGESPAYLVYFPENNCIKRVRNVKFTDVISQNEQNNEINPNLEDNIDEFIIRKEEKLNDNENEESREINKRYPERQKKRPVYLNDYVTDDVSNISKCYVDYCYNIVGIPKTYNEAITSPESYKWKEAMKDEIHSLDENNTYEFNELPEGKTVIGGKWVYAIKLGPNDEEKFKARYVAKGYSQIKDINFKDTFAPTANLNSIKMLLQVALQYDLIIHQMDVKTAYLNADIDYEIYIEQPEGFIKTNEKGEKYVLKLNKSLYGLKQSSRNWNNLIHKFLIDNNFDQSLVDNCVYTKFSNNVKVILIIWIDDIIIAASNLEALNDIKTNLNEKFKMKDLNKLKWFLGIEFNCEKDCITINQTKYITKILNKFHMLDCKPKSTPCNLSLNNDLINIESEFLPNEDIVRYREMIGSLIYLMIITRPDLCFIVTKLSQFLNKPTKYHLSLAKDVFRYIKYTSEYNLKFTKSGDLNIIGYCDSDWGGSSDRHSISGYCFRLNNNGPLISWKSKKQNTVALSTCEAEYIALAMAIQEAIYLNQLLSDMKGVKSNNLIKIHVDNQAAIALANNPVYHQRSKHIDIKYHFIRCHIQNKIVELEYISSENNIGDMFTKPLSKVKINNFLSN